MPKTTDCPICGEILEIDEEHMSKFFGQSYIQVPQSQWVFWCESCEEAGTIQEIANIALIRYNNRLDKITNEQ